MTAKIVKFGTQDKLLRNYPQAKLLIWSEEAYKVLGAKAVSYSPLQSYVVIKYRGQYLVASEIHLQKLGWQFKTLMGLKNIQGLTCENPLT